MENEMCFHPGKVLLGTLDDDDLKHEMLLWKNKRLSENSPLDIQVGGDHYKNFKIQPVKFITENNLKFLEGCVIKRVCRHRNKNGREDIEKAIHELQMILELEYDT